MTKQIKVHDNVYDGLKRIRKKGETFSEVIFRLLLLHHLLKRVEKETKNENDNKG